MPWPAAAGRPEPSGFAAESVFTLLYSNQILLSRLCFLFLLIFVYKTQGSHQSPAQSARTPLWHTPISPPGSSQDSSFLGGFPASLAPEGAFCSPVSEGPWGQPLSTGHLSPLSGPRRGWSGDLHSRLGLSPGGQGQNRPQNSEGAGDLGSLSILPLT